MSLLLTWYGDDFTGSGAVMETLEKGGVPSVLFLQVPDAALLGQPHRFGHVRVVYAAAPQLEKQGIFGVGQGGGGEFCAIEQTLDLIGRLAFGKRKPRQQPIARGVTAGLSGQPPAKPGAMPKQRVKQFQHRTAIAIVDMATRPKPARSNGIRGTRVVFDLGQKIKGGF